MRNLGEMKAFHEAPEGEGRRCNWHVPMGAGNFFPNQDMIVVLYEEMYVVFWG
jgi:hypothetical protein